MIIAGIEITEDYVKDIINRMSDDISSVTELELQIAIACIAIKSCSKRTGIIVPKANVRYFQFLQLKKQYRGIKFLKHNQYDRERNGKQIRRTITYGYSRRSR